MLCKSMAVAETKVFTCNHVCPVIGKPIKPMTVFRVRF
jgi:hypothetical protein